MTLSFELPMLTPTTNTLLRMHWRTRENVNRAWRILVVSKTGGRGRAGWPDPPPARVRATIVRSSHQAVDHDNAIGGLKPLIDALKALRLIVDDGPAHLELVAQAVKGPVRVVVTLEALP